MSTEQSSLDNSQDEPIEIEESAETEETIADENEAELPLEKQLENAQETIKDYWDQMMRLRAEIENNRKRAERDLENAHKYAIRNFVENLLPILDSMEMGQVAAGADNATLESIREGSSLTMNMFVQVMEKQGLEQIDPVGEKFDPDQHQAISMIESEDHDSNTVIEVMQKGFSLNDRLVRPAMVVVAK